MLQTVGLVDVSHAPLQQSSSFWHGAPFGLQQ